jgi:hypothetical protein
MILDEFVINKWSTNNKKYYIEKGYIFTKFGDMFLIKPIDLMINSTLKVHVKCDVCNNEKMLSYQNYNTNIKSGNYYACSPKCSQNKKKQTNLTKYGTEFVSQNKEIQEKVIKRMIEKYGVKHFSKTNIFKEKVRKTNLIKYGTEFASQNKEIQEKTKQTNLERYGVESTLQNKEIRAKINKTILDRYGVENITMNKKYSERATNTMIERYGEIWLKHCPTYNANSIIYLDRLSEKLNLSIQHAFNGGEKKFVRYWVDGYIEKYNICLEWDERQHKYKKESDVKREFFLKENFNCQIIRINQKEFLKDVDNQINLVCNKINNLIKDNYNGKPI